MVGNDEKMNAKSKVNLSLLPPCIEAHRVEAKYGSFVEFRH